MTTTKQDRTAATERLREWLKDGDTLWFILRHRSASGLQRVYSVKQLTTDIGSRDCAYCEGGKLFGDCLKCHGTKSEPVYNTCTSDLSSNIALACNFGFHSDHYGVKVNGCGFSGEHEIADTVGRLLGIKLRYETL